MAWHQRHQLGLLRARLARAGGDDDLAAELASDVMIDAEQRGTGRYAALAHAQGAVAGGDGDRERVAGSLTILRRCAALELPSVLDGLGPRFDDDGLRSEADARRAALSTAP